MVEHYESPPERQTSGYQPTYSGTGTHIPPSTGSPVQRSKSKYKMTISVDTTDVDEVMTKLNHACEKAKELKQLLKDISQTESIATVKADDIAKQIRGYKETAKRCGVTIL